MYPCRCNFLDSFISFPFINEPRTIVKLCNPYDTDVRDPPIPFPKPGARILLSRIMKGCFKLFSLKKRFLTGYFRKLVFNLKSNSKLQSLEKVTRQQCKILNLYIAYCCIRFGKVVCGYTDTYSGMCSYLSSVIRDSHVIA